MDTQVLTILLILIPIFFISLFACWASYKLGSIARAVRIAEQTNQVTLFASLWATAQAHGLKNATVIRSIVEKYNPGAKLTEEQVAEFEKKILDGLDIDASDLEQPKKRKSGHDSLMDAYPFDEELTRDKAAELV